MIGMQYAKLSSSSWERRLWLTKWDMDFVTQMQIYIFKKIKFMFWFISQ